MRHDLLNNLTPKQLQNVLYACDVGTLAEHLNLAWEILCDEDTFSQEQKRAAYHFLLFALDIEPHLEPNQAIQERMLDCLEVWEDNPEYVPEKTPYFLKLGKENIPQEQTRTVNYSNDTRTHKLLQKKELLDVNLESRLKDRAYQTIFYNPIDRASQRVMISHYNKHGQYSTEALFYKEGKPFSTDKMIAHGIRGFAGFTLNTHGELSIFDHHGMQDGIAHSSMNAGAPVVAAGQIQIHNGRLKAITGYSGHYQPTLYNNLRAIDYLLHHGIDVSQAVLFTDKDPGKTVRLRTPSKPFIDSFASSDELDGMRFQTPIPAFLSHGVSHINQKLETFSLDLEKTLRRRATHRLHELKERITSRIRPYHPGLYTTQKLTQYKEMNQQMQLLIENMNSIELASPSTMLSVTKESRAGLKQLIAHNNQLRQRHGKPINAGRLFRCITKLNHTLSEIEKQPRIRNLEKDRNSLTSLY